MTSIGDSLLLQALDRYRVKMGVKVDPGGVVSPLVETVASLAVDLTVRDLAEMVVKFHRREVDHQHLNRYPQEAEMVDLPVSPGSIL